MSQATNLKAYIRNAESNGHYVYALGASNAERAELRIIDAKTTKGVTYVRAINGFWYQTNAATSYSDR